MGILGENGGNFNANFLLSKALGYNDLLDPQALQDAAFFGASPEAILATRKRSADTRQFYDQLNQQGELERQKLAAQIYQADQHRKAQEAQQQAAQEQYKWGKEGDWATSRNSIQNAQAMELLKQAGKMRQDQGVEAGRNQRHQETMDWHARQLAQQMMISNNRMSQDQALAQARMVTNGIKPMPPDRLLMVMAQLRKANPGMPDQVLQDMADKQYMQSQISMRMSAMAPYFGAGQAGTPAQAGQGAPPAPGPTGPGVTPTPTKTKQTAPPTSSRPVSEMTDAEYGAMTPWQRTAAKTGLPASVGDAGYQSLKGFKDILGWVSGYYPMQNLWNATPSFQERLNSFYPDLQY